MDECVEECVEVCDVVELRYSAEVESVELAIALLDMEIMTVLPEGVRVGKFESTGADSVTEG